MSSWRDLTDGEGNMVVQESIQAGSVVENKFRFFFFFFFFTVTETNKHNNNNNNNKLQMLDFPKWTNFSHKRCSITSESALLWKKIAHITAGIEPRVCRSRGGRLNH